MHSSAGLRGKSGETLSNKFYYVLHTKFLSTCCDTCWQTGSILTVFTSTNSIPQEKSRLGVPHWRIVSRNADWYEMKSRGIFSARLAGKTCSSTKIALSLCSFFKERF